MGIGLGDPAAPENVIRDKKATALQSRKRQTKDAWVVGLIDVVEDDVVLFLLLRKKFKRVAHANRDALADPRSIEVAAGFIFAPFVAIPINNPSPLAHRA